MGDAFSRYHPLVNFLFFALVLAYSMVLMHPVCLAVSLLGALGAPAQERSAVTSVVEYVPADIVRNMAPAVTPLPQEPFPAEPGENIISTAPSVTQPDAAPVSPLSGPVAVLTLTWLTGMALLLLYSVVSLLRLRRRLVGAVRLEDNIYLPLVLSRVPYEEMHRRLMPLAKLLGISSLLKKHPYEVSGGQKQRAAVARALITQPSLILADEPTGALDSHSTDELLNLLDQVNAQGQTILMVTHSVKAASHARRVLFIKDGKLFHQLYRGEADRAAFYQRIADTLTLIATGGEQNV